MAVFLREFCCGRCRTQCFACGACDKHRAYCQVCSPIRRAETARLARQTHQKSDAGKADHRDHQRAHRARKSAAPLQAAFVSRSLPCDSAAQSVMDLSAKKLPSGVGCASPPVLADCALESFAGVDGVANAQSKYASRDRAGAAAVPGVGADPPSDGSADGVPSAKDAPSGMEPSAKAYSTTTPLPAICCSFCGREGQRVRLDAFRGTSRPRSKSADWRGRKFARIPTMAGPD